MWKSKWKTPLWKVTANVSLIRVVNPWLLGGGITLSSRWAWLLLVSKQTPDVQIEQSGVPRVEHENRARWFHYSCKLDSGMRARAARADISPAARRTFGPHLKVFINGNSREICLLAEFVWLSAACRNVYSSAAGVRVSQCPLLTASLKMHPVSVWVPKVTNGSSGEIWPKIASRVGCAGMKLHLSRGESSDQNRNHLQNHCCH